LPNNTDGSPAIPHGSRVKVTNKALHSFILLPPIITCFILKRWSHWCKQSILCTERYVFLLRMI